MIAVNKSFLWVERALHRIFDEHPAPSNPEVGRPCPPGPTESAGCNFALLQHSCHTIDWHQWACAACNGSSVWTVTQSLGASKDGPVEPLEAPWMRMYGSGFSGMSGREGS